MSEFTTGELCGCGKWSECFGSMDSAPEGYSKEFSSPLDAIDWLLG